MTEFDNILNQKYVDKGSYKVPDNYFCQLQNSINERIKQEEGTKTSTPASNGGTKKKFFLFSPCVKYAAAACFIGAAVLTAVGLSRQDEGKSNVMAEQKNIQNEEYYNECMEYAMVDNDDIYTYLAEQ